MIYVNGIHTIACHYTNGVIKQYADDTCIIVKARNTTELKFETNPLLFCIEQWPSANKLSINMDKTKALNIFPKLNEAIWNINLTICKFFFI